MLALREDGRPEAFQVIASRTMSELDAAASAHPDPAAGVLLRPAARRRPDLLDAPLQDRLDGMARCCPTGLTVPRAGLRDRAELAAAFAAAVADGFEGLVVKRPPPRTRPAGGRRPGSRSSRGTPSTWW